MRMHGSKQEAAGLNQGAEPAPYWHAFCAQETNNDQGRAFGHAGIVAAASAVLADLEKGGILKVCCIPCPVRKGCTFMHALVIKVTSFASQMSRGMPLWEPSATKRCPATG